MKIVIMFETIDGMEAAIKEADRWLTNSWNVYGYKRIDSFKRAGLFGAIMEVPELKTPRGWDVPDVRWHMDKFSYVDEFRGAALVTDSVKDAIDDILDMQY